MNPLPPLKTILYNGALLTKHDVLKMKITRWNANRKAFILDCILQEVITKQEAIQHFLPEDELERYMLVYLANGKKVSSLSVLTMSRVEADHIARKKR